VADRSDNSFWRWLFKANAFAYLPTVFTDNTLVVGVTTAKAQHILELRQALIPCARWPDSGRRHDDSVLVSFRHFDQDTAHLRTAVVLRGCGGSARLRAGYTILVSIQDCNQAGAYEELRQRIRNIAG